MNIIRSLITLLILALVIIATLGVFWWETPPAPIANYQLGAKIILGALAASGLFGIWKLWTAPTPAGFGK
ncbi:MAG: hypothetical protein R3F17_04955 [Planctomycetota bacterium]